MADKGPLLVSIEGPLGVGKSTLVTNISDKFSNMTPLVKVAYIPEDLATWCNWADEDLLHRAITVGDNIFLFQNVIVFSYKKALREAFSKGYDIVILERSPVSAINLFSKMALEDGNLSKGEFQFLSEYAMDIKPPDLMICLSPDVSQFKCLNDRVRSRDGDLAVDSWTEKVFFNHSKFLSDPKLGILYPGMELFHINPLLDPNIVTDQAFTRIMEAFHKRIMG